MHTYHTRTAYRCVHLKIQGQRCKLHFFPWGKFLFVRCKSISSALFFLLLEIFQQRALSWQQFYCFSTSWQNALEQILHLPIQHQDDKWPAHRHSAGSQRVVQGPVYQSAAGLLPPTPAPEMSGRGVVWVYQGGYSVLALALETIQSQICQHN